MTLIFFSSMNNKPFIALIIFNIRFLLPAVFCFECFRAYQHCNFGLGCPCVLKILCCHILLKYPNTYCTIQRCQLPSKPVSHSIIKAVLLPHSSVPKVTGKKERKLEQEASGMWQAKVQLEQRQYETGDRTVCQSCGHPEEGMNERRKSCMQFWLNDVTKHHYKTIFL